MKSNVISKIYTYKNPYEINKMNIWTDITKYPHLCVSQTLVEGLKEYYGRENFSVLCTVDSFMKKAFKEWHDSSENNIQQSIKISNILDEWEDKNVYSKRLINSIKHNKKDIIKSIRYLIESDININDIKKICNLTVEQELLFNLYSKIKDLKEFKVLEINKDKKELKTYIDECYTDILKDELKKYITRKENSIYKQNDVSIIKNINFEINAIEQRISKWKDNEKRKELYLRECKKLNRIESIKKQFEIYKKNRKLGIAKTDKVFLHGIHQFTPLILRLISLFNDAGIEVIAIFNYMSEYSEIYKTWNMVYDWTNIKFYEEGSIYNNRRDIGKGFGDIFQNKLSAINKIYPEKYYCFDNLTSFSDYVGKEYEKAVKKYKEKYGNYETITNEKLIKIALMDEQFYAINGEEINELLKVYFPEQFSSRHFLTYPVGQFIFSLYNMWDDNKNRIVVKQDYMEEALSFNIWQKDGMPTPVDMFNNIKYYFRKIDTLDAYLEAFKKLRKVSVNGKIDNRKRLAFFIYNNEELEYFYRVLCNIKRVAESIFSNPKDNIKKNFTKLMNNINNLIVNPSIDNKVSEEELNMVKDIQERIAELKDENEETYIKNIKGVIGYYIESTTSENYEAEWIVRDFEQIDGGILLAAAQKRDNNDKENEKTLHYAGVSDENILGKVKKELPWPLTSEVYMQLGSKIADICAISRNEYHNFLKYSLFYGTYFLSNNKSITLSYINKLNDNKTHPYSIISNIMNIKPKDYVGDINNLYTEEINAPDLVNNIEIDCNISDSEKRSMETCFWRYLFNHCLDKDTFFFEEWQIDQISKYFIQYTYINKEGIYDSSKFENYKRYLPIFDDADYKEIIYEIDKKNGQKDTKEYINSKMEFIFRDMKKYKKSKKKVIKDFEDELCGMNRIHYNKELCMNCNQKTLCLEFINNLDEEDND